MNNLITKISDFKEKNKFFLPNFSLLFEDYLDIFSVFKCKERVYDFMKKVIIDAYLFVEENELEDLPSPIQIGEELVFSIGIDYGFFLLKLIEFLIEEGGITEQKEKEKVYNLIYLYFGVSFENYKLNYPAHVMMKLLFGKIYGITSYKNMELKGNVFYPFFIENRFGKVIKLNLFYIKNTSLKKIFLDEKVSNFYIDFFKKNRKKLYRKINKQSQSLFETEKINLR